MSQNVKVRKLILFLFFGVLVFLYILANTVAEVYYFTEPVLGIYPESKSENDQLYIAGVKKNGPADRAGLKEGDILLAINDIALNSENAVWQLFQTLNVQENSELTVLRSGQEISFSVPAQARIRVDPVYTLLSLLPGVIFCYTLYVIGIFVLLQKLHDYKAHIFYLMVLFWALAMWEAFPFSSNALLEFLPWWFEWINAIFLPIAVGLLLHFSLVFPVQKEVFKRNRKKLYFAMYGSLFLLIPFVYIELTRSYSGRSFLEIGWGIWFTILFYMSGRAMYNTVKTAPDPHTANQARLIYRGTVFTLALPIGLYFIPKNFAHIEFPYLLLITVLWPVTLAYAIIKHRLMDTEFIIKRGVSYVLMSGFVIAAYFLFVVGIGKLVLNLTGSTSQIVTILATLFIAAVFNPVKNKIQIFVDRRFLPNRFRYREAVRAFRHRLVNVVDLRKLNDLLLDFLSEEMQIHSVAVLWNMDNNGGYAITDAKGIQSGLDTRFSDADIVIDRLQKKQGLVDVSPLKTKSDLMSADERARWEILRTELALPLLAKGRLNGLISLGIKKERQPYYKEDLDLLETLGDQINISLENALLTEELREQDRLRKELEVARRIQLSSLPQYDPDIAGLDISGISIPALEVGGDYYDYIAFADDRFGVVVGDVSGKGTSAALYMSQLKGILHTASNHHHTLKGLINEVNSVTFRNIEQKSFITLACGAFHIKKQRLSLIRAGHLPILHYSARDNRCTELQPPGIGIGLERGPIFEKELRELHLNFDSGDVFLFYTDGIVESKSTQHGDFDMSLVEEVLGQSRTHSAVWLRQEIIAKVDQFSDDSNQKDDMTLVVVKVR